MTSHELSASTLVLAVDYTPTKYGTNDTVNANLTNTTYASDSTASCTFIAPSTGRVMVSIGAECRDNSSTNYVRHSLQIIETRNNNVFVGPDSYARGTANVKAALDWQTVGSIFMLNGLTPGNEYKATLMYRVQGGSTADIDTAQIIVWPAT